MVNPKPYQQLKVCIPNNEYPIVIGKGILSNKKALRHYIPGEQLLIVTNTTVAPLYLNALQKVFADRQCDTLILKDGEAFKNQASLFKIYDTLIANKHHRDTTLVALGGGVIGDITGLAAATYQRGVAFVQCPTTLLAQVDASVGGKTAINHPHAKNMIGCFHQPRAVLIDLETLQTLPEREFRAGFAEVIKCALLAGGELFDLVNEVLRQGVELWQHEKLSALIRHCCQVKVNIVQADEHELGIRALLNLGHTFAHALEAYSHYERWLHGEAVAIGLYCAALLSHYQARLDEQSVSIIDEFLCKAKLPKRIPPDVDLTVLYEFMKQDKKIKNKTLRFILMKTIGDCYIEDQVTESLVKRVLQEASMV